MKRLKGLIMLMFIIDYRFISDGKDKGFFLIPKKNPTFQAIQRKK